MADAQAGLGWVLMSLRPLPQERLPITAPLVLNPLMARMVEAAVASAPGDPGRSGDCAGSGVQGPGAGASAQEPHSATISRGVAITLSPLRAVPPAETRARGGARHRPALAKVHPDGARRCTLTFVTTDPAAAVTSRCENAWSESKPFLPGDGLAHEEGQRSLDGLRFLHGRLVEILTGIGPWSASKGRRGGGTPPS
jgi:hypothetical protein